MRTQRISRCLLTAALLAPGLGLPAQADEPRGVTLYVDSEFRGYSQTFHDDVYSLGDVRFGNDRASSLRVDPGCVVTLYSDSGYRGRTFTITNDVYNLRTTPVGNDTLSSLEIDCRRGFGDQRYRDDRFGDDRFGDDRFGDDQRGWREERGVTLFSDAHFGGRREVFYGNDSDLRNNRVGDNAATSLRVDPGCRVTLYSEPGFRGRSVTYAQDVSGLGGSPIGNDTASSLRVDCERGDRRGGWQRRGRGQRDRGLAPRGSGGVTLYRDVAYAGPSATFYDDVRNLGHTPIGNDEVTSIRVAPGCRVVLYRDGDFRGASIAVHDHVPDLGQTPIGNDALSSMHVDCRRR